MADRSLADLGQFSGTEHWYRHALVPFTDFPRPEFALWCVDNVILLPGEY